MRCAACTTGRGHGEPCHGIQAAQPFSQAQAGRITSRLRARGFCQAEEAVLRLLARGLSNGEIARELALTRRQRVQLTEPRIYRKLCVTNRVFCHALRHPSRLGARSWRGQASRSGAAPPHMALATPGGQLQQGETVSTDGYLVFWFVIVLADRSPRLHVVR